MSAFCYAYFRLGPALAQLPLRERVLAGFFLCAEDAAAFDQLRPEWASAASADLETRVSWLQQLYPGFSLQDIFPLAAQVSSGMDMEEFIASHVEQPRLFIRIRPGKRETVLRSLGAAGIACHETGAHGLAFENATDLECLGPPDRDYVVQDISSQGTESMLPALTGADPLVWDACAGSGGKSIMASDHYRKIRLYVTDIRASILSNLEVRFHRAGIRAERMQVMDLTRPADPRAGSFIQGEGADCIIADVPCSGSGTWGREPWMLSRFTMRDLEAYAVRQRAIVSNLIPWIRPGGYLVYITCSAYAMENEAMASYIVETHGLSCEEQQLLRGYRQRGDTMFSARFRRNV